MKRFERGDPRPPGGSAHKVKRSRCESISLLKSMLAVDPAPGLKPRGSCLPRFINVARGEREEPAKAEAQVRREEGFWVAVLPFKFGGTNSEIAVLAEGLTEEIVTGLSRFPYLRVIARNLTGRYLGRRGAQDRQ